MSMNIQTKCLCTSLYLWGALNKTSGNHPLYYKDMSIRICDDHLIVSSEQGGASFRVSSGEVTAFGDCTEPVTMLEKGVAVMLEPRRPVPQNLKDAILALTVPSGTFVAKQLELAQRTIYESNNSFRSFELLWSRMTELERCLSVCRLGDQRYEAYTDPYHRVYVINNLLNELRPEGERDVRE